MLFLNDLYVVLGNQRATFYLFLASVIFDLNVLLAPILIRSRIMQPNVWGTGLHLAAGIAEVALFLGATILWVLMFYECEHSRRSVSARVVFAVAFLLGIWWTAQIYYLLVYRRFATQGS